MHKYLLSACLLLGFSSAAALADNARNNTAYSFRWQLPKSPTSYHFIQRDHTERSLFNDDLQNANDGKIVRLSRLLKSLKLTGDKDVLLTGKALGHNHFLLETTYVDPFENGAGPEYKKKLHFGGSLKGEHEWYVEFDQYGRSDMWFLADWRKDRSAFFTELPKQPIEIGGSWPLNAKLLHIEKAFRVLDDFSQRGRAKLEAVRENELGQRVAEVNFFFQEIYEWHDYQESTATAEAGAHKASDQQSITIKPFRSDLWNHDRWVLSVIGYGEFLLDEGMWSRVVTQRIMNYGPDETSYNLQAMWLKGQE